MSNNPVHWHEGQFIKPHHFQLDTRYLESQIQLTSRLHSIYNYGLQTIDIDQDALSNWRVSLRRCVGKFYGGAIIRSPDDVNIPPIQLEQEHFNNPQRRVKIYLAIPYLDMGRPNSASEDKSSITNRYIVSTEQVDDENLANNKQPIQTRRLNARLIVGDEEAKRYECIPVCRLRLASTEVATPEIDTDYIPPILSLDAWPLLNKFILAAIRDRYMSLADELARETNERGLSFLAERSEDLERLLKLQALNTVLGGITYITTIGHIHPQLAYLELCRSVGTMALFKTQRSIPHLPEYDHDNLGPVFLELRKLLDLGTEEHPSYIPRDFIGAGYQLQVRLEREWLEPSWTFYIGVKSEMSLNEVDRMLRQMLHLKAGSSDEVERLFVQGLGGVMLNPEPSPPAQLPNPKTGWTYWLVNRKSSAWRQVENSLHFAIRFNIEQSKSRIDGQKSIVVTNPENQNLISMQFTLYAVPNK